MRKVTIRTHNHGAYYYDAPGGDGYDDDDDYGDYDYGDGVCNRDSLLYSCSDDLFHHDKFVAIYIHLQCWAYLC